MENKNISCYFCGNKTTKKYYVVMDDGYKAIKQDICFDCYKEEE